MTQSSAGDGEQPRLRSGMRPWEPPSLSSVLAAVEPAREDAPFVFHDPAGRRWSRIKRVALVAAAALVVVGAGVLVALTRVAPGRAPVFSGTPTQQVPDWQVHGANAAAAPTTVTPTAAAVAAAQPPASTAGARSSPSPTARPSPTPSRKPKPTPTPRRTPLLPTPVP